VTPDGFLSRCPSLWHVGPPGAWDQIAANGFRTAEQLILRADLDQSTRAGLLNEPRRDSVRLVVDGEAVVLRDQGPLFARNDLASILDDGLSVADWVQILNRRVYLFADKVAMNKVLDKYVERDGAQDVITISPWRLLQAAGARLQLAQYNAGAIPRLTGPQRGRDTFTQISRFPDRKPAEVTILDGLDDLSVVARAERHHSDGRREQLARMK
jgi:hypothetical protein